MMRNIGGLGVVLIASLAAAALPQGGADPFRRIVVQDSPSRLSLGANGELTGPLASELRRDAPLAFAPEKVGGGLVFNGEGFAFVAQGQLELPREALGVSAIVAVERAQRWGGIAGAIEDNGDFEKGWILGFDDSSFTFGISTVGTDDGNGRLVFLKSDVPLEPGVLHGVCATYDGSVARLFVDGELRAESDEPEGAILMAESARLAIGAYLDSDEHYGLDGRILRLDIKDSVLAPEEVEAVALESMAAQGLHGGWTDANLEWTIPPFLTWPRADGVSVVAETSIPARARLRVRRDNEAKWKELGAPGGDAALIHEFQVEELEAGAKYFYDMTVTEGITGPEETTLTSETRSFRTAPEPGTESGAFTFTVVSDTQTQADVAKRVSDLAFEHRPNFVVHCGDLVDTGSDRAHWTEQFFPSMRPLIEHAPLAPVLGNHEQDADLYYNLMSLPAPERWYSLPYGNAEFFMLDGNRSLGEQSEQLRWLKKALSESEATWRFAVLHQPPYTSDSDDYGDTSQTESTRGDVNVQGILETLEEHGVDLCFSGHVHDYERTFPIRDGKVTPYAEGGIIYVTAAGGGGSLEDFDATNTWFGHKKMRRHHFVHVAIHGNHLELQAMDEDGRLFDVFDITQRGR